MFLFIFLLIVIVIVIFITGVCIHNEPVSSFCRAFLEGVANT
jgi:hypothetical protein